MEEELQLTEFLQHLPNYPGPCYLKFELEQLSVLLPQLYGYHLVQLGISDIYHLESNKSIRQFTYAGKIKQDSDRPDIIVTDFQALPFQYESIDVMLLPHTLEFCRSPEKLLSELYNIVIPGGKVILFGFNPVSYLGLTKWFKSSKNGHGLGIFRRPGKICYWLRAAGFNIESQSLGCFLPPSNREEQSPRSRSLEKMAEKYGSFLSSVYIIVAEKKIVPLIPLKPKAATAKISVRAGFPEPSTKSM